MRRRVRDVVLAKAHRAVLCRDEAHQAFHQRRLADTVAAEQGSDFAERNVEREVAQDVTAAVELV